MPFEPFPYVRVGWALVTDTPSSRTSTGSPEADTSWSVRSALRSPRRLTIEALAGLITALALIPESIAFTVVLGVDPRVGLFTSVILAMVIAFVGGRPAMASGAAGSVALVAAPMVKAQGEQGLDYLVLAVWCMAVIQILMGVLGITKLMRFIPRSVMVGFVNALAILIAWSQIEHLIHVPWAVYPLVVLGAAVVVLLPRITKVVPGPLVAVVLLTCITVLAGITVPTVGDQGELPESLPTLFLPDVPLDMETLRIVLPVAFAMALVGMMESLMTAKLVDDLTDTHSDKTREAWGLGASNLVVALFGGMGGCAMIAQTIVNVKEGGGRTRISTFLTGFFILVLCLALGPIVGLIPMAALVAVLGVAAVTTFDWHSVRPSTLRRLPASETAVMVVTVVVTVATDNLAYGVLAGVALAGILFVNRVAHLTSVERVADTDARGRGARTYRVTGQLLFASSNDLTNQFDYAGDAAEVSEVVIDLSQAHVWDASTVAALDAIETKYAQHGITVRIEGLNEDSAHRHGRLTGELG
ncbi:SulP family inorganic anion transporter [Brevibacterium litoralis]|uniref:SulP family inorganic anion transporter n=1 Tax=Brevibacterium litoralis TaxID=3138935 RepID=UPI003D9A4736